MLFLRNGAETGKNKFITMFHLGYINKLACEFWSCSGKVQFLHRALQIFIKLLGMVYK